MNTRSTVPCESRWNTLYNNVDATRVFRTQLAAENVTFPPAWRVIVILFCISPDHYCFISMDHDYSIYFLFLIHASVTAWLTENRVSNERTNIGMALALIYYFFFSFSYSIDKSALHVGHVSRLIILKTFFFLLLFTSRRTTLRLFCVYLSIFFCVYSTMDRVKNSAREIEELRATTR